MCAVLLGGPSLKHETATMAATDPLERSSRTTGTAHSLSKGRLVSLKNSSQTQRAEVGFLKLSKWEAANQYFQMCIYHAGTKVTHKKSGKHRNRLAPCCPQSRNGPDDLRVREHFTKDGCLLNDRLQEGIQKGLLSNMQEIFNPGDGLLVSPLEVWCTIATSCSTTPPQACALWVTVCSICLCCMLSAHPLWSSGPPWDWFQAPRCCHPYTSITSHSSLNKGYLVMQMVHILSSLTSLVQSPMEAVSNLRKEQCQQPQHTTLQMNQVWPTIPLQRPAPKGGWKQLTMTHGQHNSLRQSDEPLVMSLLGCTITKYSKVRREVLEKTLTWEIKATSQA